MAADARAKAATLDLRRRLLRYRVWARKACIATSRVPDFPASLNVREATENYPATPGYSLPLRMSFAPGSHLHKELGLTWGGQSCHREG